MSVNRVSHPVDIMVSGLKAQAMRMNMTAGNIANVETSRTESGGPFRRKMLTLFSEGDDLSGPEIGGFSDDMITPLKQLYAPGHPHADKDGYVDMPNIDLPIEMMQMVMASRAYQANAASLKRYQEMVDVTLELIR